ncbi:MmgE/PrpD family protein [Nocardia sp. FBN12]|uniref:MmgE/PrpD family protein n=1 Tax=Nocardia sp. FBN12 TaxID=3419766 RepID=UPI003D084D19
MTTDENAAQALAPQLAAAVIGLRFGDIPESVRSTAKTHLLDALGLALASTGMDYGHAVHQAATRLGAGDESRVLGFGTPLPAASAALANGTLIHGLDFDDTHIGAIYHPTAPALAAALAVGDAERADGESFLLAYIIGLEVGCRIAAAGAGKFHARGFHPTGIAGTFAAACVAAKLRGASAETLTNALGLCGSQAAGILELHESWLKRMHPGWAAHSGIIAVTLAEAGFRGPATVFEGAGGLFASHLGETVDAQALGLHDLGARWMTLDIALKPYPCCHFTHAFADAALALLDELGSDRISPEQIDHIDCPIAPALIPLVAEPHERKIAPTTIYDALFSVQYVVASVLAGRSVDLTTFYDLPLDEPLTLAIANKIRCIPDSNTDFPAHFSGAVTAHLTDGRVLHHAITDSLGTSQNPLSDTAVITKFLDNTRRAIPESRGPHLIKLVDELENLDDISALLAAAVIPTPPH